MKFTFILIPLRKAWTHPPPPVSLLFFKNGFGIKVKVKLVTVVEGNQKASFSIATKPRCRGGCYSFPWIASLYPWYVPYIARRYQVPFLKFLVLRDLELNPGLTHKGPYVIKQRIQKQNVGSLCFKIHKTFTETFLMLQREGLFKIYSTRNGWHISNWEECSLDNFPSKWLTITLKFFSKSQS